MTIVASILATTLSLASTNEYKFLIPQSTNLIGRTFIPEGGVIPRYEDIAFLREAYAERNEAIGAYWSPVTVPDSSAFAAGSFGGLFLPEEWFAPSFGHWDGYTRYQSGFFLRPGISVRPLFQETGPDYLWDGEFDTSLTNTIRAFVDPRTAAFPTNGLLAATLEGAPRTNVMQLAYAILTNDVWILSIDNLALGYGNWSLAERQIQTSRSRERRIDHYIESDYTYKNERGETVHGTYNTGYVLGDWTDVPIAWTNTAPMNPVWFRNYDYRRVTRPFGFRRTDAGSQHRYKVNAMPDYEDDHHSYRTVNFSGSLSAMSRLLDARLTNTIDAVKSIVVMRFRANLRDFYEGYSSVTNSFETNRYFVVAWDGNAVRHPTHPAEGGSSVWDTGVEILGLLQDIWDGMGWWNWCSSVSAPTISYENPEETDNIWLTVTAHHSRYCDIILDGIYAYFYIHRNWNAKLENNNQ